MRGSRTFFKVVRGICKFGRGHILVILLHVKFKECKFKKFEYSRGTPTSLPPLDLRTNTRVHGLTACILRLQTLF